MGTMQAYHYAKPDLAGRPRVTVDVCNTEQMLTFVAVTSVGERNLHAHAAEDATWFVLGGSVAFYDEYDKKTILAKNDFICVPAGTKYWFESVGDEDLGAWVKTP